jgi:hypothetical protein
MEAELSAGKIDRLLNVLSTLYDEPPFMSHQELYALIDAIKQGEIPWNSFSVCYNGLRPQDNVLNPLPAWMNENYEIWFRDPLQVLESQIANPEYNKMMDFAPKRVYHVGKRQYNDLMSGNWAWDQAVHRDVSHFGRKVTLLIG